MSEPKNISLPHYFKCLDCDWHGSSFRASCPTCGASQIEETATVGKGSIVDAVPVRFAPQNLSSLGRYTSVLVEFDEKFKMFGIVEGEPDQVVSGKRVSVSSYHEDTKELYFTLL